MSSLQMDAVDMLRSFLSNAAATHTAMAIASPPGKTVEYMNGYGEGKSAGELAGLALALSTLTDESVSALMAEAMTEAAVNMEFPVDVVMDLICDSDNHIGCAGFRR